MKRTFHTSRFILVDFIIAALAWITFFLTRKTILHEVLERKEISWVLFGHAILIGAFWILIYSFFGFYINVVRKSRITEFLKLIPTTFVGAVVIFFFALLDDKGVENYTEYYKTFSSYYLIHFVMIAIGRMILVSYIKSLLRNKKISFNTLLVGSNKNAREIFDEIEKSYELLGLRFVAYVHVFDKSNHLMEKELRHFGDYKNIGKIIRRCRVDDVIIAIEPSEHKKITEILNLLADYNVRISIIPDIYQLLLGSVKVNHVFDIPLLEINQDLIPVWQKSLKRGFDIVFSSLVLIIGFPFLFAVALITKVSSHGPIFYTQERIGKEGLPFKIIKYRSMFVNSEHKGPSLSSGDDPRVTTWGRFMRKTRLDEFPQFYNVLIGDMSLVGPRPERQFFIDQIVKLAPHYKHLHKVRPGITSLGQVKFGYAENVQEMVKRLKYDILYIENMSVAMDFRILFYTLLIMVQGRGK